MAASAKSRRKNHRDSGLLAVEMLPALEFDPGRLPFVSVECKSELLRRIFGGFLFAVALHMIFGPHGK
ncbi:MAG: hypothetical protein L0338_38680 [Acidobacteria bacterium]|nr:hypothetical protein [Acidobacteriota bacterium]